MAGGWIGMLAYDLGGTVERLVAPLQRDRLQLIADGEGALARPVPLDEGEAVPAQHLTAPVLVDHSSWQSYKGWH